MGERLQKLNIGYLIKVLRNFPDFVDFLGPSITGLSNRTFWENRNVLCYTRQ